MLGAIMIHGIGPEPQLMTEQPSPVLVLCLAIYYVTPFLRWNRGPGQPDQAVLIDIERIRFHFFSAELMSHDLILLTGGLVLATLILTPSAPNVRAPRRIWAPTV